MMKKKEKVPGLAKKDREHWIDFELLNRSYKYDHCIVFHCYMHISIVKFICMRKTWFSLCYLENNYISPFMFLN